MLHGADYNPDQWIDTPEVWDEDMRLMKLAHCNSMSIGIFAWSALEPHEGEYTFDWLDTIMDKLAENGNFALLATPSGSKPAWMSLTYPEIRRIGPDGIRQPHKGRHNHCRTSPVYRDKCVEINTRLAQRYKDHPALLVWHVSNEYNGNPCYCDLCMNAFRDWLKKKYAGDLDKLNRSWWSRFWSHTFTDWDQITAIDNSIVGMHVDWKRFSCDQTIDFFRTESAPLRALTPDVPVTTNFMPHFYSLDYAKFARHLDIVSVDSYPVWHRENDIDTATTTGFFLDLHRSLKQGRPFMLMESVPSAVQWREYCTLKRPGMHILSSLQAIAHGSDTVQYFQWRKGRGGVEQFHGAVVDHAGHENTRVFADVAGVGLALEKLSPVVGTTIRPQVGLIFDWENNWLLESTTALGKGVVKYEETTVSHYAPFRQLGIPVDVIDQNSDFSRYSLLVAPMLFSLRPGVAERLAAYVKEGGSLVLTYWSGIVDENGLAFLEGTPGDGLRDVFGIWDEEIDALDPSKTNQLIMTDNNELDLHAGYRIIELCSLIHAENANVLATYGDDFYAGRPVLTANRYGKGKAFYLAGRTEPRFLYDFYGSLVRLRGIRPVLCSPLPEGVSATKRSDGTHDFLFLMNFATAPLAVQLDEGEYHDMLENTGVSGKITLPGYGVRVLRAASREH